MSEQETSGSAYAELAGRLADVIQGVGQHAERLLNEAEAEAERILTEAREEAARVSGNAREEADRVLSELGEHRAAMLRYMRLVDDRVAHATSEVEAMIEAFDPEGDDPLVIDEDDSAENETKGELSAYIALWGLDERANSPEDSAKR
jgi:cell division septum initiation protein DivIVA